MGLILKFIKKNVNLNEAKLSMVGLGESWPKYKI